MDEFWHDYASCLWLQMVRSLSVSEELDRVVGSCGAHTQADCITAFRSLSIYGALPWNETVQCLGLIGSTPRQYRLLSKYHCINSSWPKPSGVMGPSSSYDWSSVNATYSVVHLIFLSISHTVQPCGLTLDWPHAPSLIALSLFFHCHEHMINFYSKIHGPLAVIWKTQTKSDKILNMSDLSTSDNPRAIIFMYFSLWNQICRIHYICPEISDVLILDPASEPEWENFCLWFSSFWKVKVMVLQKKAH